MKEEKKYHLYLTVLKFLLFKITENLKRINLDINLDDKDMLLTAYYASAPSQLELELLDDIATNSNAQIPDFYVDYKVKLMEEYKKDEKHDFIVFATYDENCW